MMNDDVKRAEQEKKLEVGPSSPICNVCLVVLNTLLNCIALTLYRKTHVLASLFSAHTKMVMAVIQRLYVSAKAFLSQLVPSDPAINLDQLPLSAEIRPPVLSLSTVNQETPRPPNSQPSSQATDLESQLPETLPQELPLASINLQTPPPQQQHSLTTNHQPTNTESAVNQRFPWAKILIAFCLSTATQNDLTYEQIDQHTKPYLKLYLRAACIALTFVSLILSQLIHDKLPLASRMLEKVGINLGFASFFIILALPLMT
jgi:hypothetical protein